MTVISIPAQLDIPDLMNMLEGMQITETQYALVSKKEVCNISFIFLMLFVRLSAKAVPIWNIWSAIR